MARYDIRYLMLLISLVWSCAVPSKHNSELVQYKSEISITGKQVKESGILFLISENGCVGCNNTVVKFATGYLKRDDVFLLTNASPAVIDLSPLGDFEKYQTDLKLNQTQILFFRNDSIVKRYHIDPEHMKDELDKVSDEINVFP